MLVHDGSSFRNVEQQQLATLKVITWRIRLYKTAERQATGLNWGVIEGPSAENCMEQLRKCREEHRRLLEAARLQDDGSWGGYRFVSKPFAVVARGAFGPSAAEQLQQAQARREQEARAAQAQAQLAARQEEIRQQLQRTSQERQRRESEARAREAACRQAEQQQRIYAGTVARLEALQAQQQAINSAFDQLQELMRAKFEKERLEDEARAAREEEREASREAARIAQQEQALQEQLQREQQAAEAATASAPSVPSPIAAQEEALPDPASGSGVVFRPAAAPGSTLLGRVLSQDPPAAAASQDELRDKSAGWLLRRLYNQERDTRLLGEDAARALGRGRILEAEADFVQNEVLKDSIPENVRMEGDAWRLLFARGASGDLVGHVNGHVDFADRWIFDRLDVSAPAVPSGNVSAGNAPAPVRPRPSPTSGAAAATPTASDSDRVEAVRRQVEAVRTAPTGEPRRQQLRRLIQDTQAVPADATKRRGFLYIRAAAAVDLADAEACREARRALQAAGADQPADDMERRILNALDQQAAR